MQPLARPLFICSAIEQCRETANCCAHKQPHIKDERCVPRECRYAPNAESVDCVPYPLEKPVAPVKYEPAIVTSTTMELIKNESPVPVKEPVVVTQETDIKQAVKKQQKRGSRKKAGAS